MMIFAALHIGIGLIGFIVFGILAATAERKLWFPAFLNALFGVLNFMMAGHLIGKLL